MRTRSLLLVVLSLALIPLSASAWSTRLQGLGSPSLAVGQELPSALSGVGLFPTDQYNVGLSAIPDPVDIFTLPQQLGNEKLFPSNGLVAEWTGATTGDGGLIFKPQGPMTFAIFLLRPGNNGFAIGNARNALPNLGTFAGDSGLAITAPTAPSNIVDLFFSYKLGSILLGGGLGLAYSVAGNLNESTAGTANSSVTDTSSSLAATARLGASMPLGSAGLDAGIIAVVGMADAKEVTGATPPAPYGANLNNSLNAANVALAVNVRGTLPLADTLDFAALGNFSMLPQNYSASNAAGALTNSTTLIDPSGIWSAGTGAGLTWKATDSLVITGYLGAIVGAGDWVAFVGAPKSSTLWVTLKPLLSGEVKPLPWLTIRGGVSYVGIFNTTTINPNTGGTASTTVTWFTGASASAGMSVQVTPKVLLEMVVNLSNFTNGGNIQAPFVSTSLKMDQ